MIFKILKISHLQESITIIIIALLILWNRSTIQWTRKVESILRNGCKVCYRIATKCDLKTFAAMAVHHFCAWNSPRNVTPRHKWNGSTKGEKQVKGLAPGAIILSAIYSLGRLATPIFIPFPILCIFTKKKNWTDHRSVINDVSQNRMWDYSNNKHGQGIKVDHNWIM